MKWVSETCCHECDKQCWQSSCCYALDKWKDADIYHFNTSCPASDQYHVCFLSVLEIRSDNAMQSCWYSVCLLRAKSKSFRAFDLCDSRILSVVQLQKLNANITHKQTTHTNNYWQGSCHCVQQYVTWRHEKLRLNQ